MIKIYIQLFISKILYPISYLFPVKKNRVIFKSYDLKYNCNTKYLCEFLNKKHNNEFELVYVVKDDKHAEELNKKGIKTCKNSSLKYHYYMFTSGFIIVNHSYPQYIPKKKNQVSIFTDHGLTLFKYYKTFSEKENKNLKNQNKKFDKLLFSSKLDAFFGKEKFGCNEDRILYSGLPRVSLFFDENFKCEIDIKKQLGIDENIKTILYAPTFRADHKKKKIENDFAKIINACEKRFGGKFIILNRDHNFTLLDDGSKYSKEYIIECNSIEDTQELLYSCDVIISDYSSLIWDVSFSKKPCFLYMYDLDEYQKTWGFNTDPSKWPYPIAKNIDDLCNSIINYNESEYFERIKEFHNYVGLYEKGDSCEQIYDYMKSKM